MKVTILGNGPSLNDVNLRTLECITIGCNHIWKSGFVPDYHCVWDLSFFKLETKDIDLNTGTQWVVNEEVWKYAKTRLPSDTIVVPLKNAPLQMEDGFDIINGVAHSHTVITLLCIPLAVHLLKGTKDPVIEVYGVDHHNEKLHFYNQEVDPLTETLRSFGMEPPPIEFNKEMKDLITDEFEYAVKLVHKHGIEIYNCSEKSKCTAIPRRHTIH